MLLAFEVVLFGGLAFMFFCILRNQDSMLKACAKSTALFFPRWPNWRSASPRSSSLSQPSPLRSLAVQPPYPPEGKQAPSQAWDRASEPAEKASSPLDGLSMDPPSSLGYSDDNPPKGACPN